MEKRYSRIVLTALVAVLLAVSGLGAQESPAAEEASQDAPQRIRNWVLRFGVLVADTTGDTSVAVGPGGTDVRLSGGGGGFVSLERRVSPLIGIEFNLIGMGSDLNVSTGYGHKHSTYSDIDMLSMGSIALGVNFHFVKDGPLDVYAGPMLTFNNYTELSVLSGFDGHWPEKHDEWTTIRWQDDSEVTWGAKAGLDILLGKKKKWSVGASLTYMDASYRFRADSDSEGATMSLDPLMFSFGAGFRF